jgi:hypothetical protein
VLCYTTVIIQSGTLLLTKEYASIATLENHISGCNTVVLPISRTPSHISINTTLLRFVAYHWRFVRLSSSNVLSVNGDAQVSSPMARKSTV